MTIEAPQGTSGRVSVPQLGAARTIAMDGAIVWQNGNAAGDLRAVLEGDRVVFTGVTGARTFNWRQ